MAQLRLLEPASSKEAANSQCSFHEMNLGFDLLVMAAMVSIVATRLLQKRKERKDQNTFAISPYCFKQSLRYSFMQEHQKPVIMGVLYVRNRSESVKDDVLFVSLERLACSQINGDF